MLVLAFAGPGPVEGYPVAAETIGQEACYAADRRDADAGPVVNAAVGETLLQEFDDPPAVHERLELGVAPRRTRLSGP